MAVYAIGDIQGCYDPLRHLLDEIDFEPNADTLWFAGDLVNRGPKSLKTLRFVKSLGDAARPVLGNHDLHLLALHAGVLDVSSRFDSLQRTLAAADIDELCDWLRKQPLARFDKKSRTLMTHAGTHPEWTVKKTLKYAAEVEEVLRGDDFGALLVKMYGNTPTKWKTGLKGYRRLRFIINCLTRMRMMTEQQRLNFSYSGPPWRARKTLTPWFDMPNRQSVDTRIVFGHWSQLGLIVRPDLVCLDSGCVWGRELTAVRLDKRVPRVIQVAGQQP